MPFDDVETDFATRQTQRRRLTQAALDTHNASIAAAATRATAVATDRAAKLAAWDRIKVLSAKGWTGMTDAERDEFVREQAKLAPV